LIPPTCMRESKHQPVMLGDTVCPKLTLPNPPARPATHIISYFHHTVGLPRSSVFTFCLLNLDIISLA
jgi:hypothetical protein